VEWPCIGLAWRCALPLSAASERGMQPPHKQPFRPLQGQAPTRSETAREHARPLRPHRFAA
jgi:hypothetical protein